MSRSTLSLPIFQTSARTPEPNPNHSLMPRYQCRSLSPPPQPTPTAGPLTLRGQASIPTRSSRRNRAWSPKQQCGPGTLLAYTAQPPLPPPPDCTAQPPPSPPHHRTQHPVHSAHLCSVLSYAQYSAIPSPAACADTAGKGGMQDGCNAVRRDSVGTVPAEKGRAPRCGVGGAPRVGVGGWACGSSHASWPPAAWPSPLWQLQRVVAAATGRTRSCSRLSDNSSIGQT